ncbi:MAG: helix-turn-helix domain-containing protein [Oligoflexia bacterium]|nr:helix-turn-helix domain-containing protein [Oligoflexia bacterium]
MDPIVISLKIKKIMKAKKLKYSDLASHLEMSESGVKKLLSGKDFSMNKLSLIADFLELGLVELIESSKEQEFVEHKLNGEIEAFFVNNWDHFCFYWLFVAEVTPLETILSDYGLEFKDVEKYLLKLDSFDLIEYHSKEKIVINEDNSFTWGADGPLVKKMLTTWSHSLMNDCVENNKTNGRRMGLFSVRMGRKTMEEFTAEMGKLVQEFTEKGVYDCHTGKQDLVNFAFTYAFRPQSFPEKVDFLS